MSDTAKQLATLRDMHAKGVLSLSQGGETVTFASGEDLRKRIAYLQGELDRESGSARASGGFHYPTYTKGL